jgi:hypothetical protein
MKIVLQISIAKIRIFVAGRKEGRKLTFGTLERREGIYGGNWKETTMFGWLFFLQSIPSSSFLSFLLFCCCPCGFGPDEEVGRKQGKKRRGKCK